MALVFESGDLKVGDQQTHTFANNVRSAGAAMQQYDLGYDRTEMQEETNQESNPNGGPAVDDHHVLSLKASVSIVSISGEQVTVKVDGEIRDSSNNHGGGTVGYVLVADTG